MGKVATKKTAGILGDDLAVNAEKATGFQASRELPVLWAITKGSFLNKLIILPVAFVLSAFAGWIIEPILVAGGVYLAYEGVEKILNHLLPHPPSDPTHSAPPSESEKIRSAILVDFILSIEIVIIALGSVSEAAFPVQIAIVSGIAVLATVGVYGLVAAIVRMDDAGLALMGRDSTAAQSLGRFLVRFLPWLIKAIGAVGTAALILVSGGIFVHHVPFVHDALHALPDLAAEILAGLSIGLVALGIVAVFKSVRSKHQ
jgi:predicted DNA repair protein MutK